MLQLGIALLVHSLWLIVTLIAALAVMACIVIPREERYLARRFGADYLDYTCLRAPLAMTSHHHLEQTVRMPEAGGWLISNAQAARCAHA